MAILLVEDEPDHAEPTQLTLEGGNMLARRPRRHSGSRDADDLSVSTRRMA